MAKSPKTDQWSPNKFIRSVTGGGTAELLDKDERQYQARLRKENRDRISAKDRTEMIKSLSTTNNRPATSAIAVPDYIEKIFRNSTQTSIDNARTRQMTPEISQASAFMTSAIISPNDLRQGKISITCNETSLTPAQKPNLLKYLQEYFEEKFKFSTNLAKWIDEALYRSGAKGLLVVPMSSLEQQILHDGESVSTESLQALNSQYEQMGSLFGITSAGDKDIDSISNSTLEIATESLSSYAGNGDKKTPPPSSRFNSTWKKITESIISEESIEITDNPFRFRMDATQNKVAKASLRGKLARMTAIGYGKVKATPNPDLKRKDAIRPFVEIKHVEGAHTGEPLFMEVPTQAIIPIFVPGNPTDTLGYMLITDENGHFATLTEGSMKNGPYQSNGDRYNFDQIYEAAGYNANSNGRRSSEAESVMARLYQSIVESYLSERVQKAGFSNVSIGAGPSVYRYMLNQYLANRRTRLVYVPADMMTYLAFEHGPDGRGVSDLEKAKWVLSIKNCLQMCRLHTAMNNAIDRKKLTIINGDENADTGYILQQIDELVRQHISKNMWNISTDPQQMNSQLVEKSYQVNVEGAKGINYKVEEGDRTSNNSPIDTELGEELQKQLVMALLIPAAAMNALDGNEYSRSVVTENLFFSNVVLHRQKVVIKHISELLRHYTRYSPDLRKSILSFIAEPNSDDDSHLKDGNIDLNQISEDDKERLENIISSIEISLPPPNIAPNKALYDTIKDASSAADDIINAMLADELIGDDPSLKESIATMKSFMKHQFMLKALENNGVDSSFVLTLDSIEPTDILRLRQQLVNLSKGLIRQDKVMGVKADNEEAGGNAGGFGGGFGGSDSFGGGDSFGDSGGGDFTSATGGSPSGGGDFNSF